MPDRIIKQDAKCGGCGDCCECLSALPDGQTCDSYCAHIERCKAMFGQQGTETHCQWIPSRANPRSVALHNSPWRDAPPNADDRLPAFFLCWKPDFVAPREVGCNVLYVWREPAIFGPSSTGAPPGEIMAVLPGTNTAMIVRALRGAKWYKIHIPPLPVVVKLSSP